MKIQKLPAEAMCKLQSGIIITDAVQCVLELVRNSLDAEATGIAIRIDLKSYQIRVIDNGRGIDKDDLKFVGERFMTSKYHPSVTMENSLPTYGFRGQALSSLQDVSKCLKIETKTEEGGPTFVKVFQNNKALPITKSENDRSGTGTTVTIDDFMFTMPVRRKRISEVFDMEEIKTQLQYLAIIHYNVCFTLRNENKALILLQTPQASNILEAVRNVYGKTVAKSLMPLYCEEKKYELTGFISLKPLAQNNIQLLYINKRIVSKGVVHKFMNSVIKEYRGKKSLLGDSPTDKVLKKLKSSCNVFIIQINCPHSYYELFSNGRKVTVEFKNWKDALKCVHKAVKRAFKDVSNWDSSSNTLQHDGKNKAGKEEEGRKVFGTSLLVNAVRGAPAKRCCKNNSAKIKSKIKLTHGKEKSEVLLSRISKNDILETDNALNKTTNQNEFSNDSLESPIPKKLLKKVKSNCDSNLKKSIINQSFVEFYEWLKVKFQTDAQACDLYNEFLTFKNTVVHSNEVTQFESPVLGGKLKRKQAPNFKNKIKEKKQKTLASDLSLLDEEMAVVTQKQLKIFPNQQLRLRKAFEFTTDMNAHVPETLNLGCVRGESFSCEKFNSPIFKKPEVVSIWRNERQIEFNHTLRSLPSSEVQFTNIIKFRNLSESFFRRTYDLPEKTFSTLNTWASHYHDLEPGIVESSFLEQEFRNVERNVDQHSKVDNFVSSMIENEEATIGKNKILEDFGFSNGPNRSLSLVELTNKTKTVIAHDVEVQVNMSGFPAQDVNVRIQTFQEVPESPSFGSSYIFSQGTVGENSKVTSEKEQQKEKLADNLHQDVPAPDCWNFSDQLQVEQSNNQQEHISDDNKTRSNKSSLNQMNFASNEFVCGHKSQSSTKAESMSKETQTLAVIWTESLTKMGYPSENTKTIIHNLSKSKSEDTLLPESSTMPQTIPIEEIQCDLTEQIESGFCVTERHDFVPKGLSPKFLSPEIAKMTTLSLSEKCKIKLTIDDAQSEFLASIKWQDESTGDFIKPSIPDGIIFEMRRKAEEDEMNYENPVLSAALSYCAVKVHNLLHSFAFTKDLLSGVEILGQLDKKFIVTKMNISTPKKMELISLFDQHAVDERIKLEELVNGNMSFEGKFLSSRLDPPVQCKLAESDLQFISDLKEKLLYLGITVKEIDGSTLSVNEIPTFLIKKHENDLKNKKESSLSDVVKALILSVIEEVKETRGVVSNIPKIMHNAFCLEACRKAIKFNKSLSVERMIEMITQLQNCKLPFQCAHGRPSVIPIIDLEDFRTMMEESKVLDLQKLKEFLKERKRDSAIGNNAF